MLKFSFIPLSNFDLNIKVKSSLHQKLLNSQNFTEILRNKYKIYKNKKGDFNDDILKILKILFNVVLIRHSIGITEL